MGLFDKIAEAAKQDQTKKDFDVALSPEKVNQRISRPEAPAGPPKPFATATPPVGAPMTGAENPSLYTNTDRAAETISQIARAQQPTATPPVGAPDTGIENPANYPAPIAEPEAPVAVPAPAVDLAPTPTEPVPAVAAMGPPAVGPQPPAAAPPEMDSGARAEAKKEPKFIDKLKTLAQKIGVPLLHLLQAGAYGYAGVNKPTVLETLTAQKAERQKTEEGRAYDERARQADRAFAERMAAVQRQYEQEASTARTAAEQKQAEYNAQQAMQRLREQMAGAERLARIEGETSGRGKTLNWDELLK